MKRILILSAIILFSIASHAQKKFTIEGTIKGVPNEAVVILASLSNERYPFFYNEDTCQIVNGLFKIEGETSPKSTSAFDYSASLGKLNIPLWKSRKSDGNLEWMWIQVVHPDLPSTAVFVVISAKKKTKITIEGDINISPLLWSIKNNIREQKFCNEYSRINYGYVASSRDAYCKLCSTESNEERADAYNKLDSINELRIQKELDLVKQKPRTEFSLFVLSCLAKESKWSETFKYREVVEYIFSNLSEKEKKSYYGFCANLYLK